MAKTVIFNNAKVVLATSTGDASSTGRDVSTYVRAVRLTRTYDIHDDTVMGLTDHSVKPGLGNWTAELTLLQNFDTAQAQNIDKLLNDLADVGSTGKSFSVEVRPFNAVRSSDNPGYQGLAILESYTPMDGSVGDRLQTVVPFRGAGSLFRYASSSA